MITYETDLERSLMADKDRLDFLESQAKLNGGLPDGMTLREYIDSKRDAVGVAPNRCEEW